METVVVEKWEHNEERISFKANKKVTEDKKALISKAKISFYIQKPSRKNRALKEQIFREQRITLFRNKK